MKRIELVLEGVAWTDRATKYATCVAGHQYAERVTS